MKFLAILAVLLVATACTKKEEVAVAPAAAPVVDAGEPTIAGGEGEGEAAPAAPVAPAVAK